MVDDTETAPAVGSPSDFDREFANEVGPEAPAPVEAAPETPVVEASEPAAPPVDGPSRDQQGRFAKPTPPAPPAAPAAPVAAAPLAPPQSPPAAAEETPPQEQAHPEASYRADGKDFTVPGSKVGDDGVFIPAAQWPQIERLIGQGQVHQGSYQQKLSESAQSVQRETLRANAAEQSKSEVFDRLLKMAEDGSIEDWLAEVQRNLPVLLAKAEAKAAQDQLKHYDSERATHQAQQSEAQLIPQMESALEKAVLHYGTAAKLSQERMQALYQRLNTAAYRKALFSQADADDPVNGFRAGDWVMDFGLVEQEVAWAGPGQVPQQAADKVAQAAAANAKAAQTATTPPTVGAKTGATPRPGPAKKFASAAEADEHIWGEGFGELAR